MMLLTKFFQNIFCLHANTSCMLLTPLCFPEACSASNAMLLSPPFFFREWQLINNHQKSRNIAQVRNEYGKTTLYHWKNGGIPLRTIRYVLVRGELEQSGGFYHENISPAECHRGIAFSCFFQELELLSVVSGKIHIDKSRFDTYAKIKIN